jgi:hypothetical protein
MLTTAFAFYSICSRVYNKMLICLKGFYSARIQRYCTDFPRQELQMSRFCGSVYIIVAFVERMRMLGQNRARTSSAMLMITNHDVPRYSTFCIPELLHNSFSNTFNGVNPAAFWAVLFRGSIIFLSSVLNFSRTLCRHCENVFQKTRNVQYTSFLRTYSSA